MSENIFKLEYWDRNHGMNIPKQDANAIIEELKTKKGYKKACIILMNSYMKNYFYNRVVSLCKEQVGDLKDRFASIEIFCTDEKEEADQILKS